MINNNIHIKIFERLAFLQLLLIVFTAGNAQEVSFRITGRKVITDGSQPMLGLSLLNTPVTYRSVLAGPGDLKYVIKNKGTEFSIPALSGIEYAMLADRIVTYGDSLHKHVVANVYANIYSGTGSLVKSLGLVASWPYATAYTPKGYFLVAGNSNAYGKSKDKKFSVFDTEGNLVWSKPLPDLTPVNIYASLDRNYYALVLYDAAAGVNGIYYYDATGNLVATDNSFTGISGIEFLPGGKCVITSGDTWHLINLTGAYTRISSGRLKGNAVGRYPVTMLNQENFLVLSTNSKTGKGYVLHAFNSAGKLLAIQELDGNPHWQAYRMAEVLDGEKITLLKSNELVEMKLGQ